MEDIYAAISRHRHDYIKDPASPNSVEEMDVNVLSASEEEKIPSWTNSDCQAYVGGRLNARKLIHQFSFHGHKTSDKEQFCTSEIPIELNYVWA